MDDEAGVGTVSGRLEKEDKNSGYGIDTFVCAYSGDWSVRTGDGCGSAVRNPVSGVQCCTAHRNCVRALGHIMGKPADTEPEPDVEKRLNIVQRAGKWLYLG